MCSLVAEILQSTGKLAKEDLILKSSELAEKIDSIKIEIMEKIKIKSTGVMPVFLNLQNYSRSVRNLTSDYEMIKNQIEKEIKPVMANSAMELTDTMKDLFRIEYMIDLSKSLIVLHKEIQEAEHSLHLNSYLKTVEHLNHFEQTMKMLDKYNMKNKNDIHILCTLQKKYVLVKENLTSCLEASWRQRITITSNSESNKKVVSIQLIKTKPKDEKELLFALCHLKQMKPLLKELGAQFLGKVCETVLNSSIKFSKSQDPKCLTLTVVQDHTPKPAEAFQTLKEVFTFLDSSYFHQLVAENPEQRLWDVFGHVLEEDFSDLLLEQCLKKSFPKQSSQMESFHLEMEAAENFCNFLRELKFLSCQNNSLKNFILEVDTAPVNQMVMVFLGRARSIMQKPIHPTVYEGQRPIDNPNVENQRKGLSPSTFHFPYCQISQSIKELVQLLIQIKDEAKLMGLDHALKLLGASRSIVELYSSVALIYHKEAIEKIPQQTAIFHNNCMYLVDHLCKLGILYQSELGSDPKILSLSFIDYVPEIRKLAEEVFLKQMREQKQQLLQSLQAHEAFTGVLLDHHSVRGAEKAVKQCLCQLQFLRTAWSEVLPVDVYFKALGTLFNACVEEIILRILTAEDIAADAAAQMDSVFAILRKDGPDFFKVQSIDRSHCVHFYVKKWFKYQELHLVLSASLREIVDRFCKGPLATHFTADEVKHLIRSLFQNTERRAAALAKIK